MSTAEIVRIYEIVCIAAIIVYVLFAGSPAPVAETTARFDTMPVNSLDCYGLKI